MTGDGSELVAEPQEEPGSLGPPAFRGSSGGKHPTPSAPQSSGRGQVLQESIRDCEAGETLIVWPSGVASSGGKLLSPLRNTDNTRISPPLKPSHGLTHKDSWEGLALLYSKGLSLSALSNDIIETIFSDSCRRKERLE